MVQIENIINKICISIKILISLSDTHYGSMINHMQTELTVLLN